METNGSQPGYGPDAQGICVHVEVTVHGIRDEARLRLEPETVEDATSFMSEVVREAEELASQIWKRANENFDQPE